jgi:hypothetical protein
MPAMLRTCTVCTAEFHGRADAVYCSPACRQKSYRARSKVEPGEDQQRNNDAAVISGIMLSFQPKMMPTYGKWAKKELIKVMKQAIENLEESLSSS